VSQEAFGQWAVLELMGHRRLTGYVTEQQVAGNGFIRIDVPGDDNTPPATQLYSPSAVYCITPTTEEIARQFAERSKPEPIHVWELKRPEPDAPTELPLEEDDDEVLHGSWR
jgi:hypothetical protein